MFDLSCRGMELEVPQICWQTVFYQKYGFRLYIELKTGGFILKLIESNLILIYNEIKTRLIFITDSLLERELLITYVFGSLEANLH